MREHIKQTMQQFGFSLTNGVYTKTTVAYDPPVMIIINNEKRIQPGVQHQVVFEVEDICTGWIEPPHEDIEWVAFRLIVDGETAYDVQEGFYNYEQKLFTAICQHLFRT